jgi:hypothetical protein
VFYAGARSLDNSNSVPLPCEPLDEMAADKSCAAGYYRYAVHAIRSSI